MSVTVTSNQTYRQFDACVHVSNGLAELYVATGTGPRIVHFGLIGGSNLLWVDSDRVMSVVNPALEAAFQKGDTYPVLGGHRLSCCPHDPLNSYYPDTDPVTLTLTETGCILTAPVQSPSELQLSMEIRMDAQNPRVSVRHRIHNTSDSRMVTLAPWAITLLTPGGLAVIPQSKANTGLLPDRQVVLWPYTDMGDPRVTWSDQYIAVSQNQEIAAPFRVGLHNRLGYALYQVGGAVFKKIFNTLPKAEYPDCGSSFEAFTNAYTMEMSTLAPLSTLYAGQSATHEEEWLCYAQDEALEADQLIQKYGG